MTPLVYYILSGICVIMVLMGINMMSKVKSSVAGNALSAFSMALAVGLIYVKGVGNTGMGIIIALIAALLEELDKAYTALEHKALGDYLDAYRRDCVNLGKTVQLLRGESRETAEAVGIGADFGLKIRTENGEEKTIRSGEVSVRGMYGYLE